MERRSCVGRGPTTVIAGYAADDERLDGACGSIGALFRVGAFESRARH
jgi:hypothetical protein